MIKGEIRKLCKAVDNLTEAVQTLILAVRAQERTESPAALTAKPGLKPGPVPDPTVADPTVCGHTQCGLINNDRSVCDHTRERYRSEYHCG